MTALANTNMHSRITDRGTPGMAAEAPSGEAAGPAAADVIDAGTKRTVQRIPLLTVRAGPRDGARWVDRLKEEYTALIQARRGVLPVAPRPPPLRAVRAVEAVRLCICACMCMCVCVRLSACLCVYVFVCLSACQSGGVSVYACVRQCSQLSVTCACVQYIKINKEGDNDWFSIESNPQGTK